MVDTRAPHAFGVATAAAGLLIVACWPHDAAAQRGGAFGRTISRSGAPTQLGTLRSTMPANPSTSIAPSAMPPSAIGTPAPQVAPVAPLTPQTSTTFLGGGGTTVTTPGGTSTLTAPGGLSTTVPSAVGATATFPGGGRTPVARTATSASQSAPSTPGGGPEGYQACMGFWDAQTHMNKHEWSVSCRRVENRLNSLKSELMKPMQPTKPSAGTVSAYRPMARRTLRHRR